MFNWDGEAAGDQKATFERATTEVIVKRLGFSKIITFAPTDGSAGLKLHGTTVRHQEAVRSRQAGPPPPHRRGRRRRGGLDRGLPALTSAGAGQRVQGGRPATPDPRGTT